MSIVLPKTLAERQAGIKAKRNASSIPYDMVTLQYHDSLDGERLRYHDDKVRYRAAVRSSNLLKNGGSRAGYDILTGGDVRGLQKPSYPQASGRWRRRWPRRVGERWPTKKPGWPRERVTTSMDTALGPAWKMNSRGSYRTRCVTTRLPRLPRVTRRPSSA